MKKTLSTLLLFLVVMSLAGSVSAHGIDQECASPQVQMFAAHDGPPPQDPPPAPPAPPKHKHHHHHPKPVPPEPPQPDHHF
ncbi:MAG: hypothetical protein H6Q67_1782 [Firmicutes bacterium]|nr:hypothetical protein [Bacillota bacterium]